ncbi:MAG: hypothetical protein HYY76_12060 [Acidobacteria bacterium]|nr:hypothetical protein [Acidobacteriota bacterium]
MPSRLEPPHDPAGIDAAAHRRVLLLVAALTATMLVLVAQSQIYDTNFYLLWEATALLLGDHPYRDFFEWGAPLPAYLSAGMQLVFGYRLIGEFLMHWLFITAGVVISFHVGLRLSRSIGASLVMFALALPIVAFTPTYHYSKLFFFPVAIWLSWRYMDRPSPRRGAIFGLTTAAAFLFRHDYGVYIGFASLAAFLLARLAVPDSRRAASMLADAAAYAAAVAVIVLPWMIVVHVNEGFGEYIRLRAFLYERPSTTLVYPSLFMWDPVEVLASWVRAPESPVAAANAALWLRQVGLMVPIVLLGTALLEWRRDRRGSGTVSRDVWRMMLAGAVLAVVASALFREPPYVVVSAPLTAALSARFLTGTGALARSVTIAIVLLSGVAAVIWTRDSPIYRPSELPRSVSRAFDRLLTSPPEPAESDGTPSPLLRYLRDCSTPGDRLIVTGSTPFQVLYYARRAPAGGHIFWRQRWRRDPAYEQQSLAMLQRQSVPFAFSTNDPVLEDFKFYPKIWEYLEENYVELQGTKGNVLVDRRRQPTRTFEPGGYPCFR